MRNVRNKEQDNRKAMGSLRITIPLECRKLQNIVEEKTHRRRM